MPHRRHNRLRAKCASTSVRAINFLSLLPCLIPPCPLGSQYQVLDVVGEGAYGIVCSAVHRPSGRKVAIKKIAPFDHSMFCLRTLRELKLLKFLSEAGVSENVSAGGAVVALRCAHRVLQIISILDIIKPPSIEQFKEVYRACQPRLPARTEPSTRASQSSKNSWKLTCTV